MNWVEETLNCLPESAWESLVGRIKEDVRHYTGLVKDSGLRMEWDAGNILIALPKDDVGNWVRVLKLDPPAKGMLVVSGEITEGKNQPSTRRVDLLPRTDTNGQCRFFYEGGTLELWQASRLILQPVLFPGS